MIFKRVFHVLFLIMVAYLTKENGDMIGNKEVRQYIKSLQKRCKIYGVNPPVINKTKSGHLKIRIRDNVIVLPSTPSDWRFRKNADSEFKKVFSVV